MKRTRLLALTIFASLAMTACGGSSGSGPSNKHPGELPSGGSKIDPSSEQGQQALSTAVANLLSVREREVPAYNGMEVEINATGQKAELHVSDISIGMGSGAKLQTQYYANVKASADAKATLTMGSDGGRNTNAKLAVSGLGLGLSVDAKIPDVINGISMESLANTIDFKESLNLSGLKATAYYDGGEGNLYADVSDGSVKSAVNTVSKLVNKVSKKFTGEDLGLDLNQLLDMVLPTRKLMYDANFRIPAIQNWSPFSLIPAEISSEEILGYLAYAQSFGVTFETYSNGDFGLQLSLDKEKALGVAQIIAALAFKYDLSSQPYFRIISEALTTLDVEAAIVVNKDGFITYVSQSLDVVADYTLKDYPIDSEMGEFTLGAKLSGSLHEGFSASAKYGDFRVSMPSDLENYIPVGEESIYEYEE